MDTNTKTVVVIGHGRSGTSMVSGILDILGVKMDYVENPNKGNPKGDFESMEALAINDLLLREASGGEDYFLDIPSFEKIQKIGQNYLNRIKEFTESHSGLWGFKDPRTSLTIDLYMPFLEGLHIVHARREEEGVVNSQIASSAGKYSREDVLSNLQTYEERIQKFKEENSFPWIDVSFGDVITDPVGEAYKLADFLSVEITEEKQEKIIDFVIPRNKIKTEKRKASFIGLFRKVKNKLWKS